MESGTAKGELASRRTAEQIGTTSYRDLQAGYSFTVPAGWVFHSRSSFNGPGTSVDVIDPESPASVIITGKSQKTDPKLIELELMAGVEQRKLNRPEFTTRGLTTDWLLGGHRAITWIADNPANGRVQYLTWVQSEATRASIGVVVDAAEFERFRIRFQPILDSFRMP
jgi:hypothetical protein